MISFNRGGTGHNHGAALLESHFKGARISGLLPFLDRAGLRYLAGVASGGDDSGVRDGVTVPYAFMTFANLALEPPEPQERLEPQEKTVTQVRLVQQDRQASFIGLPLMLVVSQQVNYSLVRLQIKLQSTQAR